MNMRQPGSIAALGLTQKSLSGAAACVIKEKKNEEY